MRENIRVSRVAVEVTTHHNELGVVIGLVQNTQAFDGVAPILAA
jgi:hypothetical protein